MYPEKEIKISKNVTGKLLGILPWYYSNLTRFDLVYSSVLDTDTDNMVPIKVMSNFNSSDIFIPVQPDFIEREYSYKYYLMSDIAASIGGIGGFLKPIMTRLV